MATPKKKPAPKKAPVPKAPVKKTPAKKPARAVSSKKAVAKTRSTPVKRPNNKKTATVTATAPKKTATAPAPKKEQQSVSSVSQIVGTYDSSFKMPEANAVHNADQLASCIAMKNYAFMEFCESGGESHPTVYKDCNGYPTIAHGVLLTKQGSNYYCKVDGKACRIPSNASLTEQQQRQLSQFMLKDKVKVCQDYIHNYEMLLPSEQFLAADLTYQGAIKGSDFILFERECDDATAVLAKKQKGNKERCALRVQASLITKKVKELAKEEGIDPQALSQQVCSYLSDPKTMAEVQKAVYGNKKISADEKKLLQPTDLALALACQTSYCACSQTPPHIDRNTLIANYNGRKTPVSDSVFNASINGQVPETMVEYQGMLGGKVPAEYVEVVKAIEQKEKELVNGTKKNPTIPVTLWEKHKKCPHIDIYEDELTDEGRILDNNNIDSSKSSLTNTLAQAQEKRPTESTRAPNSAGQSYS